jgi:hypothetical protein
MLLNPKEVIDGNMITINLERQRLVLDLRTASANDMILDKEGTESNDLLDAFGFACKRITVEH